MLTKWRRWNGLPAELDIKIIVLLLRRHTAVIHHYIPEGAEEASIRMRQPHMEIIAELSGSQTRAGEGAGFTESNHKVPENTCRVADITLPPAPGQRNAYLKV